jgi:DNA-binding SARP family transcriptional activator
MAAKLESMPVSTLALRLLGPPRIEREGAPIEVDTRKAIALIAYLAVTGEPHSRESLANLLWPDYDQRHAHAALRRTLSTLNKALAGQHLQIGREAVALEAAGVWLDVAAFRDGLARARAAPCPGGLAPLGEAVAAYRDDFMAGFTLRDSPNFDEWQFFQTESLRRELAAALEQLAACLGEQGDFEAAVGHARRWLALDSLHEPAHRALMRLYAWLGQRAAAMRQYRECARILEQELGVAPLAETTQLYEAIKENRLAGRGEGFKAQGSEPKTQDPRPKTQPSPPALQSPISNYPLVGREREWAALAAAYEAARAEGRFAALEGEAGIGKTRLAEAFLEHARSMGSAVIVARCYQGESKLAYGPFLEGLRAALQGSLTGGAARPDWSAGLEAHWLSEAARLLPELAGLRGDLPPAALEGPGAQSRFFEGISQVLLALLAVPGEDGAGEAQPPGVLFLDDLHWADEASLDLLNYLVRRLRGRRLFILGAWRGEEVPANHRLRQTLADAGRNGLAALAPLSRLNRSAVTELVERAAPGQAGSLTERVYRESEGLPFFIVEYLAMLADGRRAPQAEGSWSLPGSVRDLLESRLALTDETGRQLLSAAAAIGRSFDFETLQEASGRAVEEIVGGLEGLVRQGLVREVPSEEPGGPLLYDFSHEKLRSLVYESASLARRRLLHQRIAQSLEQRARLRRQLGAAAGQVAEHYRLGGREPEAAALFKLAGEHARGLFANAEALAHFRSALALVDPHDRAEVAGLHEAVGDLQTLAGDYTAALAAYETAAAGREGRELAGLEHKAGRVYARRGNWELAQSHYQAALQALDSEAPGGRASERARVYADWSLTAHRTAAASRALELAQQALALAEAGGDQRALAQAHNILGMLASSRGDLDGAWLHLEQSLSLAESLGDPGASAAALNNLAQAHRRGGRLPEALALTERALALCASQGDRHREAALHNNLADLLHETGQREAAMAHLKQAVALFAEVGADAQAGRWQPEIWKLTEW